MYTGPLYMIDVFVLILLAPFLLFALLFALWAICALLDLLWLCLFTSDEEFEKVTGVDVRARCCGCDLVASPGEKRTGGAEQHAGQTTKEQNEEQASENPGLATGGKGAAPTPMSRNEP